MRRVLSLNSQTTVQEFIEPKPIELCNWITQASYLNVTTVRYFLIIDHLGETKLLYEIDDKNEEKGAVFMRTQEKETLSNKATLFSRCNTS